VAVREAHRGAFGQDAFGRGGERAARFFGTPQMSTQADAAIKTETDRLVDLLSSNTELTRQDKELTERVEALTREIYSISVARGSGGPPPPGSQPGT
jgi:hypothetical protein